MDATTAALPLWLTGLGWIVSLPAAAVAPVVAPWRRLVDDLAMHTWCGGALLLVLLWQVPHGGIFPGHLLGVAAYTLLVGPALALTGAALAVALGAALHGGGWSDAGVTYALVVLPPVAVTCLVAGLFRRLHTLPAAVRLVVNAWTAGALSRIATGLLVSALPGALPLAVAKGSDEIAVLVIGLACAEAMFTGLALLLVAIHRPEMVDRLATLDRPGVAAPRHGRDPSESADR